MKLKDCPFKPHKKEIGIIKVPAIFPTQETKWSWQGAVGEKGTCEIYSQGGMGARGGGTQHEPRAPSRNTACSSGQFGKKEIKEWFMNRVLYYSGSI